jgi:hypothetical protein
MIDTLRLYALRRAQSGIYDCGARPATVGAVTARGWLVSVALYRDMIKREEW